MDVNECKPVGGVHPRTHAVRLLWPVWPGGSRENLIQNGNILNFGSRALEGANIGVNVSGLLVAQAVFRIVWHAGHRQNRRVVRAKPKEPDEVGFVREIWRITSKQTRISGFTVVAMTPEANVA